MLNFPRRILRGVDGRKHSEEFLVMPKTPNSMEKQKMVEKTSSTFNTKSESLSEGNVTSFTEGLDRKELKVQPV